MLSEEALQIAKKRREVKSKGENERYKHLNAEFQRDMNLSKLQEMVKDRGPGVLQSVGHRVGHNLVTEQQQQLENNPEQLRT